MDNYDNYKVNVNMSIGEFDAQYPFILFRQPNQTAIVTPVQYHHIISTCNQIIKERLFHHLKRRKLISLYSIIAYVMACVVIGLSTTLIFINIKLLPLYIFIVLFGSIIATVSLIVAIVGGYSKIKIAQKNTLNEIKAFLQYINKEVHLKNGVQFLINPIDEQFVNSLNYSYGYNNSSDTNKGKREVPFVPSIEIIVLKERIDCSHLYDEPNPTHLSNINLGFVNQPQQNEIQLNNAGNTAYHYDINTSTPQTNNNVYTDPQYVHTNNAYAQQQPIYTNSEQYVQQNESYYTPMMYADENGKSTNTENQPFSHNIF